MSSTTPESESESESGAPRLDARIVRWLATQLRADRHARLGDGGAAVSDRVELATVFIDLPMHARIRDRSLEPSVSRETGGTMRRLLGRRAGAKHDGLRPVVDRRWLVIGGPGSGKSTLTQMLAQQLRMHWIGRQIADLSGESRDFREDVDRSLASLRALADRQGWQAIESLVPLRISLPDCAGWLAQRNSDEATLWDYLGLRMGHDLRMEPRDSDALREVLAGLDRVVWILDGLDEVPVSATRDQLVDVVRRTICAADRHADGVIVCTREQGYQGEFDDLDEMQLGSLPIADATRFATALLEAWHIDDAAERVDAEFARVEDLLTTPLHATMAALLLAKRRRLPAARWTLFEYYFDTIFDRELGKPIEHGIQDEERGIVRTIHAHAGLALHVRSQAGSEARPTLRRRELRKLLTAIHIDLGHDEERAQQSVERFMRFAEDRLVLLLHNTQGEYEFSIRSLQEFFAADALLRGDPGAVRTRLEAIATHPHWSNVLAFVVSNVARDQTLEREHALERSVGLCRTLNAGGRGRAAAACQLGSTLALHMLAETRRYGHPWLHEPLWAIALEATTSSPHWHDTTNWIATKSAWRSQTSLPAQLGRLAAISDEAYQACVLETARRALAEGVRQSLSGWTLLEGLLRIEHPGAIALANERAPIRREDGCMILEAMASNEPSRWLVAFVDAHADWLLGRWYARVLPAVSRLARVIQHIDLASREIEWEVSPYQSYWQGSSRGIASFDISDLGGANRLSQVLQALQSPSPSSFADVLDGIADETELQDLRSFTAPLAWPLSRCLAAAMSLSDLRCFATMLREGRLGTLADWRAAEARWGKKTVASKEDALLWLRAEGPWNTDIGERGSLLHNAFVLYRFDETSRCAFIDDLCERIEASDHASSKLSFVRVWIWVSLPMPLRVAKLVPRKLDGMWPVQSSALIFGLVGEDAEAWYDLLDQRGRAGQIACEDAPVEVDNAEVASRLIERMRTHPSQWGLLEALSTFVTPGVDLSALMVPSIPDTAPLHIKEVAASLRLLTEPGSPEVLGALCQQADAVLGHVAANLARRPHVTTDIEQRILAIVDYLDAAPTTKTRVEQRVLVLDALRLVQLRGSLPVFDTPEAWTQHQLPSPWLSPAQSPRPPRLRRIVELSNIRLFKTTPTIDVEFPSPPGDVGQWIVLIGENAVGKTTLLRALALAIAAPDVASGLLDEERPMIRNGGDGRIALELDTGMFAVAVSRGERKETVEAWEPAAWERPWVVGYGVRRGNARGEDDRPVKRGAIGELHLLFEGPASPHNAMRWLAKLEAAALREQRRTGRDSASELGPRGLTWKAVRHALEDLLGIRDLEVDEEEFVYVTHEKMGRVRLDSLSDGYLTTLGWVIDMIARWIDRQSELDELIGPDLLRQMTGFVLIDEIDLHLHPTWQLTILDDIRRVFPRMSFVVTTHNPLTLHGARRGEIYVMRHAEGGGIELVQRDIRPGHDIDRVLFEQFGVKATYDADTRKLLARHSELVIRGVERDEPERAALERQLRARLGGLADAVHEEREQTQRPAKLTREQREELLARYPKRSTGKGAVPEE